MEKRDKKDRESLEELLKRYNIDLKKLENEQIKLAKGLEIKDLDLNTIEKIGAMETIIVKNKIISAVVVMDKNFEIIEQAYFIDKLRFPYIYGYKSYRILPSMVSAFGKIQEKPDIILIKGKGINHERLGLASHFSLVSNIPTIAIDDKLFDENKAGNKTGDDVLMNDKKVGTVLISKSGAKPLFVCPGNKISIKNSFDFIKGLLVEPHKLPEPLHVAHRYAKEIKKEFKFD